jgi:hypothetical protein
MHGQADSSGGCCGFVTSSLPSEPVSPHRFPKSISQLGLNQRHSEQIRSLLTENFAIVG